MHARKTEEFVLGIDLGTTFFKLGLFDRRGILRGLGRVAVEVDRGRDGRRAELAVERFEALIRRAWRDACRAANIDPETMRPYGIAYSSQANSFILLDAGDRPLSPLILWTDRRAAATAEPVSAYACRSDRLETTGIGLDIGPQFCINKLAWWREREPDAWRRARRLMTISDYLTWRLTGKRAGDLSTAALLGIVDARAGNWWPAALRDIGIDPDILNPLFPSGTVIGTTGASAQALGLPPGIPAALGGLDHFMAATGLGVPGRAPVGVSLGTVLACLAIVPDYRPQRDCCCGRGFEKQGYTLLTFSENGGGGLEWFRRRHAAGRGLAELDAEAARIPMGCAGLRALPDAAGRDDLSGFTGASARHTPAHYFRALMESSARTLHEILQPLASSPPTIILSGGGARSALWREIVQEITGCRTLTGNCPEPACGGAAMTAAAAAGWFRDTAQAAAAWADAPGSTA